MRTEQFQLIRVKNLMNFQKKKFQPIQVKSLSKSRGKILSKSRGKNILKFYRVRNIRNINLNWGGGY